MSEPMKLIAGIIIGAVIVGTHGQMLVNIATAIAHALGGT